MQVSVIVVLLGVAAAAATPLATPSDDYFFFHRPAVHLYRPVSPVRYVVRQYSTPFSPFHYLDDDHFDRKKRSAEPQPLASGTNSRQKRNADFDGDDFHFYPVARLAPRVYRPAVYYRPAVLPYVFGRDFYDDK